MIDEVKGTIFDADQQLGKCQIPLTKVKRLMKEDDDTKSVGADVTYLVALATEEFIKMIVGRSYDFAKGDKRKTIYYKDFYRAVKEIDQAFFLVDILDQIKGQQTHMDESKDVAAAGDDVEDLKDDAGSDLDAGSKFNNDDDSLS